MSANIRSNSKRDTVDKEHDNDFIRVTDLPSLINSITFLNMLPLLLIFIIVFVAHLCVEFSNQKLASGQLSLLAEPSNSKIYIVGKQQYQKYNLPRFRYGVRQLSDNSDKYLIFDMQRIAYADSSKHHDDVKYSGYKDYFGNQPALKDSNEIKEIKWFEVAQTIFILKQDLLQL